jgi:hypothetical protein
VSELPKTFRVIFLVENDNISEDELSKRIDTALRQGPKAIGGWERPRVVELDEKNFYYSRHNRELEEYLPRHTPVCTCDGGGTCKFCGGKMWNIPTERNL